MSWWPPRSPRHNIGHLVAAEGDTVKPDGKYLIAMNKWALDRFQKVGPLLPQNFQLVDLTGPKMQLLYDMPLPLGEPHYAQMIKADKAGTFPLYCTEFCSALHLEMAGYLLVEPK